VTVKHFVKAKQTRKCRVEGPSRSLQRGALRREKSSVRIEFTRRHGQRVRGVGRLRGTFPIQAPH